jgi:ubiquinone biosynthesis protein COQ4
MFKGLTDGFKRAYMAALESPATEFESRLLQLQEQLPNAATLEDLRFCVRLAQSAYVTPDDNLTVIDRAIEEWEKPGVSMEGCELNMRSVPVALQDFIWGQIENGVDLDWCSRELDKVLGVELKTAYINSMLKQEGLEVAFADRYVAPQSKLEDFTDYAAGTFGYFFYHQLADQQLSADFLPNYSPPPADAPIIDYIVYRMYQTHDLRHVLAGYSLSPAGEIGLQGFELAQANIPFSAHILTWHCTLTLLANPVELGGLLGLVANGWKHGRQTRSLLPVHWEEFWDVPLATLRDNYELTPMEDYPQVK